MRWPGKKKRTNSVPGDEKTVLPTSQSMANFSTYHRAKQSPSHTSSENPSLSTMFMQDEHHQQEQLSLHEKNNDKKEPQHDLQHDPQQKLSHDPQQGLQHNSQPDPQQDTQQEPEQKSRQNSSHNSPNLPQDHQDHHDPQNSESDQPLDPKSPPSPKSTKLTTYNLPSTIPGTPIAPFNYSANLKQTPSPPSAPNHFKRLSLSATPKQRQHSSSQSSFSSTSSGNNKLRHHRKSVSLEASFTTLSLSNYQGLNLKSNAVPVKEVSLLNSESAGPPTKSLESTSILTTELGITAVANMRKKHDHSQSGSQLDFDFHHDSDHHSSSSVPNPTLRDMNAKHPRSTSISSTHSFSPTLASLEHHQNPAQQLSHSKAITSSFPFASSAVEHPVENNTLATTITTTTGTPPLPSFPLIKNSPPDSESTQFDGTSSASAVLISKKTPPPVPNNSQPDIPHLKPVSPSLFSSSPPNL